KPWFGDLQKLPSLELVKLQKHPNEFFVRHARRILQERVTPGLASPEMSVAGVRQALVTMLETETESTRKLRALWTLWAIGAADSHFLLEQLASPDAHVREWAVRLLSDGPPERTALEKFVALAKTDPAPAVRLALASALQKIPLNQRAPLALALVAHAEDATDRTLPLMLWYGIEPLIASKNIDAAALLKETAIPKVLQLVARRIASEHEGAADQAILNKTRTALYEWIDKPQSVAATRAALTGVREAQEGTINSKATTNPAYRYLSPDTTARLIESDDAEIRNTALILSLWSGDEKARDVLKKIVMDKKKPTVDREGALSALVTAFGPELKRLWVVVDGRVQDRSVDGESVDLSPMLHGLLDEPEMRVAALRRLPIFDNPATSAEILKRYDAMSLSEKQEALTALASRPKMALPLLAAIEAKTVPQSDVSAYTVRQLQALKSDEINAKLTALWGTLRAPAEGKAELMKEYKSWLTAPAIMKADAKKGRAVFTRTCAGCHTLFDAGGNVGPNLTGSQRANVDYLLENLLDPSAVVANSYQTNVVETSDGRTIVGVVEQENDQSLALKTPGGLVVVAKSDVADRQKSPLSLMPENMLQLMPREDLLDLAAYLASDEQVTALEARPGEANNAPKK
ncbi:MAG TPA: HEAT repeat domain-containing protein, partial [Pirellulales bacterium]